MHRAIAKVLNPAFANCFKIVRVPQRAFGKLPAERYSNMTRGYDEFLPSEGPEYHATPLERHEIETRILSILRHFEKVDLRSLTMTEDFKKDLKLDSLERIALITSIEAEFNTVFEDRVFDNLNTLDEVIRFVGSDLNNA